MSSWLESKAPKRFAELLGDQGTVATISNAATSSNPPHLLLSGPSGVGKTAIWKLIARQVLGPGWQSTTHTLNARDLSRTSGAMRKFEEFLRPQGSDSKDTLVGRTSLDAFDSSMITIRGDGGPPAENETYNQKNESITPISRIIVIEDADYLGAIRQAYLRRMMEHSSATSRFIFTTTTPSRLIDALRSRTQHIRLRRLTRQEIENHLNTIADEESIDFARGVLGDIAHICDGNLRKAIFMLQLMHSRGLLGQRKHLQELASSAKVREVQLILEEAMRGKVHDWKWEQSGGRNQRILKGAMGILDKVMQKQNLEAEDIVKHTHKLLTEGRLNFDQKILCEILQVLAECEIALLKTSQPRVELEKFLINVSTICGTYA